MEIPVSQKGRDRKIEGKRNEKKHFRSKAHKRGSQSSQWKAQSASLVINKKVWSFLDGSIQNRKTQSLWSLTQSKRFIAQIIDISLACSGSQQERKNTKQDQSKLEELCVPCRFFCWKGSAGRRIKSWDIAARGSTASRSSPLPGGTRTSWCTYKWRMNNRHQHLLHIP